MKTILDIATAAGMTHDAIQRDRSGLSEHSITSFSELHGEKWDDTFEEIDRLGSAIDFNDIMEHAERFVATHQNHFQVALGL